MEIRATITYATPATDRQVGRLLDELLERLPDNGPVVTTARGSDLVDVVIAFDAPSPWEATPMYADLVSTAFPAAGLGVVEPIGITAIDASRAEQLDAAHA